MNAGQFLITLKEVLQALEDAGALTTDGVFHFDDLATDFTLINKVESILKAKGVVVPARVDQIIAALPLIVTFFR